MKILMIEDSQFQRAILKDMLEPWGHEVIETGSGDEAQEKIREHTPDCILMDLFMPKSDGVSLLRELQRNNSKIPIVVITADVREKIRETCLRLGVKEFVNKPVKEDRLRPVLEQIAAGKES